MPCRINRRRLWTGRILLEAGLHDFSSFATLTYSDDNVTDLNPDHLQAFWKALRYELGFPIRYFAVGEYGELRFRPHYHAIIFGLPFTASAVVEKAWGLGFISLGEVNAATAAYVTGYVSKKMTAWEDPRLEGRHPEFARMSRRPGLGKVAAVEVADRLTDRGGSSAIAQVGDVASEVRINGKKYPLGRYLRNAIREAVGWEQGAPEIVRRQLAFEKSLEDTAAVEKLARRREASDLSANARAKINAQRRTLS